MKPSSTHAEIEKSNRTLLDIPQRMPPDPRDGRNPHTEYQVYPPKEPKQSTKPRHEVAKSSIGETPEVVQDPVQEYCSSDPAQSTATPTTQGVPSPRRYLVRLISHFRYNEASYPSFPLFASLDYHT